LFSSFGFAADRQSSRTGAAFQRETYEKYMTGRISTGQNCSGHKGRQNETFKAYDALIGLPERAPDALLADKGYDADAIRADLAGREIEAVIPGRSNRRVKIEHDRRLYKQRNRIERMFGHLKINRAIATRCDQLANSFLGMVHLAAARY
jgi:transposase